MSGQDKKDVWLCGMLFAFLTIVILRIASCSEREDTLAVERAKIKCEQKK